MGNFSKLGPIWKLLRYDAWASMMPPCTRKQSPKNNFCFAHENSDMFSHLYQLVSCCTALQVQVAHNMMQDKSQQNILNAKPCGKTENMAVTRPVCHLLSVDTKKEKHNTMKREISPAVWVLFILFISLIALVTYLYWETKVGQIHGLERYINIVYRVSTLMSILVAIYVIQFNFSQSRREEKSRIQAELQQGTIDIQKLFLDPALSNDLHPLYLEMNPQLTNQNDVTQKEYIVANIIFRRIEQIIDVSGPNIQEQFLRLWAAWFSSPKIRKVWDMCRHNYSSGMQSLVETTLYPIGLTDIHSSSGHFSSN